MRGLGESNEEAFTRYLQLTGNPQAAAIIVLADAIDGVAGELRDFDHQIGVGIKAAMEKNLSVFVNGAIDTSS